MIDVRHAASGHTAGGLLRRSGPGVYRLCRGHLKASTANFDRGAL